MAISVQTVNNGDSGATARSKINTNATNLGNAVNNEQGFIDVTDTSASANTITVAFTGYSAYTEGDKFAVKVNNDNTGATTINVQSVGAKNIYFNGAALGGGELIDGQIYTIVYNSTLSTGVFELISASSNLPTLEQSIFAAQIFS